MCCFKENTSDMKHDCLQQKRSNGYGLRQRRKYKLSAVRPVLCANRYLREIKSGNNMAVL
jgi:hypothetical protein